MILTLSSVHSYYGESHILRGINLGVEQGRVVALLGRNGAGKTTTMRTIMGLTPAREGQVEFYAQDITRLPTFAIARAGIGFVPSGRRLFGDLTVHQNLLLGAQLKRQNQKAEWTFDSVHALFPMLAELADRPGRVLSGGEQQMLKLARCLLGNPLLLMLDEPTEGLAPNLVWQLSRTLQDLKRTGIPMLISEQNARFALTIADDAYLLEKGSIRYGGLAAEMAERPEFKQHLAV